MMQSPDTQDGALDIIRGSIADRRSLRIIGGGTRSALGRAVAADEELSVSRLTGITLYEPAELVMSARTGTPLAEIEQTLEARGQMMAFEPPDWRAVLQADGVPTIGGVFAVNASGPRRVASGAARDHLLGVTFINGRGELHRAGGRVMKNVTGLDVTKLVCGAYGTVGLMTEVTFKVLPRAGFEQTLVIDEADAATAVDLMTRAMGSPFEVSGAAWRNEQVLLRIEGVAQSVRYRIGSLSSRLRREGVIVEGEQSSSIWRGVRTLEALDTQADTEIWRISVAPSKASAVLQAIPADANLLLDWSGGLIWVATRQPLERQLRPAAAQLGGHAMLFRAEAERRHAVLPFHPLPAATKRLTQGLKASLDPSGLFNPGKMYEDI